MRLLSALLACLIASACASSSGTHDRAGGATSSAKATSAVSGCFRYSVATDRTAYPKGSVVTVLVSAVNISPKACLGPGCGGLRPWFQVVRPDGQAVYRTAAVAAMCVRNPQPRAHVAPGATVTWFRGQWAPAASVTGTYRIVWHWLQTLTVKSATLTLG